jgi:hypothetical protein
VLLHNVLQSMQVEWRIEPQPDLRPLVGAGTRRERNNLGAMLLFILVCAPDEAPEPGPAMQKPTHRLTHNRGSTRAPVSQNAPSL